MFRTHFDAIEIPAKKFKKTTVPRFWVIDITQDVLRIVVASGVREGIVVVSVQHTTAGFMTMGIIANENERGLLEKDLPEMLARLCPDGEFEHDSEERLRKLIDEPKNGVSHLRTILGSRESFTGIIHEFALRQSKWKAIILMDFDLDGRPGRIVEVQVMGNG